MNSSRNPEWGTWCFSKNAQGKLDSLSHQFQCHSSNPKECLNLNNKIWRVLIDQIKSQSSTESAHDEGVYSENRVDFVDEISVQETSTEETRIMDYDLSAGMGKYSLENVLDPVSQEMVSEASKCSSAADLENILEDEDLMKISGDICDSLRKGPVKDLSLMLKGKDVVQILKAIKISSSDEEAISNLLLSVCPPVEENLLEQSRWIPAIYQHIILPEILGRSSPMPRSLSSAVSQLASSSPDACVQLLCMPLLAPLNQNEGQYQLSEPILEVLSKILEESLPSQQKALLFRTYFKSMSRGGPSTVQEDLFLLFTSMAETDGAFTGAEPEFLSNLIDWLDVGSSQYASNIKFAKFLVAVLKGMAQDASCRRENNYISSEDGEKLRNVVLQNKTFLKKIADKTLKSILSA